MSTKSLNRDEFVKSTLENFPDAILVDTKKNRQKRTRRTILNSARGIQNELEGKSYRSAMITATYAPNEEWNPRDITVLIKSIREYLKNRGVDKFRYVWKLELTKAGKTHYHVVFWLPKGLTLPKPDKRGWWSKGCTRIEWIKKNAVGYVAKYLSKSDDSVFDIPAGARLCGSGGLCDSARVFRSWWNFPAYVRSFFGYPQKITRILGGFVSASGDFLKSQYEVLSKFPLIIMRL
jgi:hypothetical protein